MTTPVPIDHDLARHEAALRFLFDRIDYERTPRMPYGRRTLKLDRMRELLERLGNPQQEMPIVHVAGTKGKGSTATMVAGMLVAAGYRVGVFSSPHLDRVEERMAVDGRACHANELVGLVDRFRPVVEAMDRAARDRDPDETGPTYFEITTAMALQHFADREVDLAVLEVGLGGRLDSTNVCRPSVCVITSISFDHTRQLGNTLDAIAREKAGIVKPGVPVISGVTDHEPREAIREVCRRQGAPLHELGVDFDFDYRPPHHLQHGPATGELDFRRTDGPVDFRGIPLSLPGRHQAANAAVALAVIEQLRSDRWAVPEEAIKLGMADLVLPARVEVLARQPVVVADAAHNVASTESLLEVLDESFQCRRRFLIFAGTKEKDVRGMLGRLLGRFDEVVFTQYLNNPRAVPPEELQGIAAELSGREFPVYRQPADAWEAVRGMADCEDLICVTGSFFIAAEMRRLLTTYPINVTAEGEEKQSA